MVQFFYQCCCTCYAFWMKLICVSVWFSFMLIKPLSNKKWLVCVCVLGRAVGEWYLFCNLLTQRSCEWYGSPELLFADWQDSTSVSHCLNIPPTNMYKLSSLINEKHWLFIYLIFLVSLLRWPLWMSLFQEVLSLFLKLGSSALVLLR